MLSLSVARNADRALNSEYRESQCKSARTRLRRLSDALRSGQIVAVKGIGGYHLLCDAANCATVAVLRARKSRPDKPLAVMFPLEPGLGALRRAAVLDLNHEAMLRDPIRPVVLVPKSDVCDLAPAVAPGCGEIGAMLPYSPLHYLLLEDFGGPLVATSGNISGEPVMTDNDMAATRLGCHRRRISSS